jgi:PAS domain S-box-containing protein
MRDSITSGIWLHAVLESAPVMLCVATDCGSFVYVNRRWSDFAGIPPTEAGGGYWHDTVHPDDRERVRELYAQAVFDKAPFDAAFRLRGSDGAYRKVCGAGSPLMREGRFAGFIVACRDDDSTHPDRQSESEWSPELYRQLTETMPALVLRTSASGEVDYCNARLLEYCGVALEDLQGTRWLDFIHPDDVRRGRDVFVRRLRETRPFVSEYRIRRADGAYRWHLTQTAPLVGAGGRQAGWLACSIDVDDRRRAEDDVRRYIEEIDRANGAKDEFLSLMSHELRTPLTTIYGNAYVLRRERELEADSAQAALADIETDAVRLRHLFDNVFVLARSDAAVSVEPLLLPRAARRCIAEHMLRNPDRRIEMEVAGDVGPVRSDAGYTDQILTNLLIHAERSSPPGAVITVRVECRNTQGACVRVMDRSDAVTQRRMGDLLKAPGRSDAPETRTDDIGLMASKRLVDALSGEMWARARRDGGMEVGFSLPLETEAIV